MSPPLPDPFQSTDNANASSDSIPGFSLPIRTTRSNVNPGASTPSPALSSKSTTGQGTVLDSPDSSDAFKFGASATPVTPPNSAPRRGQDPKQPSMTFNFGVTDNHTSDRPPVFNPNPWALAPTRVFGSDMMAGQAFTFKDLHNASPLPSREPSPAPLLREKGKAAGFPAPLLTPSSSQSSVAGARSLSQTPDSLRGASSPTRPSLDSSNYLLGSPLSIDKSTRDAPPAGEPSGREAQPVALLPYDLRNEETPQHRFFSPEFQVALRQGLEIAKNTAEAIEKTGDIASDDIPSKFLETAKRLSVFHGSDTRTIAILGDSGEGKSSLINSLLHFPGVAKTGDIGSACTSVVTEYRQKTNEHTAPITIEVEYLSSSEIEAVLKELLWSYRQLYLPGVESNETSAQDYARYERESAQAWSALEAAFKHKKEFRQERLRDMSDGALEKIASELVQWSREIEWPDGGENGIWKSTATTAEECCEKTELFMRDKYWPFTKIIRIYLNAQVLKTGVVLADLPGLQDTNLARVRATQDYLMKCNNIFIVAKISRAITDQSLKTSLFTVLARHVPLEWEESAAKSLNVAVVCTKSEDIDLETARREFCGDGKRVSATTIKQLDKEINDAKRAGDSELKKKLKLKRELIFIEARNQHVTEGLQKAYASKVPDKKLEVFCVSNKLYGKHTRKGNSDIVLASGIPPLRKFCHSITAEAQLREAKHFLQCSLFSLLNSLHMWAASSLADVHDTSAESKETLNDTLNQTKSDWKQAISDLTRDISKCIEEQILDMYQHRQTNWSRAASSEGRQWHSWHWSQYNAWCLNNGNHATPKRDHVDWNAKIIWKMRTELEFQWDLVEEETSTVFGNLLSKVTSLLEGIQVIVLETCPSEFQDSLIDGIDARIKDCEYRISLSEQSFSRELKLTRRYASESNHSSYVLQQMIPAYRDASNQSGSGKAARQRQIVQGRITDEALFASIYFAMSEKLNRIVLVAEDSLRILHRQTFKAIEDDINIALSGLPESNMSADDVQGLEELLDKISRLKGQAEAAGKVAAN